MGPSISRPFEICDPDLIILKENQINVIIEKQVHNWIKDYKLGKIKRYKLAYVEMGA